MHVLKFGGTSMTDENSWRRVLNIIASQKNSVVVVSATDRTTRQLAAAAKTAVINLDEAQNMSRKIEQRHRKLVNNFLTHSNIDQAGKAEQQCSEWIDTYRSTLFEQLKQINQQQKISAIQNDAVLSLGEQLSAYLFAVCGTVFGLDMDWVDARSVIKTDSNFGDAQPNFSKIQKRVESIKNKLENNIIPVIGGFYGENDRHEITTLGFEGSDCTASLIGSALNAKAIEIWTDVSGIYTCDPRTVSSARPIEKLSFNDAEQLAMHGAKVLHPDTIQPAATKGIPIRVKNIFKPEKNGTKIDKNKPAQGFCKAIAYLEEASILSVKTSNRSIREHRLVEIFAILDDYKSSTTVIETTKTTTNVVLKHSKVIDELEAKLSEISPVLKNEHQAIISLVGCNASADVDHKAYIKNVLSAKPTFSHFDDKKGVLNIIVDKDLLLTSVNELHKTIFEKKQV